MLLNIDAIQWVGSLALDLSALNVHFASAGSHKELLASIGTGFFYCRKDMLEALDPPNVGYHTVGKGEAHLDYELTSRPDAGRFEEALVNMPGIWGLDAAIRMQLAIGSARIESHILGLVEYAREQLKARGADVVGPSGSGETSSLLPFRLPGEDSEALVMRLRAEGIDVTPRAGDVRLLQRRVGHRSAYWRAVGSGSAGAPATSASA